MEVIKFLYRCCCGHGFYKDRKRWIVAANNKCEKCGGRKTKFVRQVLKVKREKSKNPR